MIEYPKRGPYFAHKTFRLMHKSMVAAELGRDVLCLLAVILHTEDAARYRGPVSFFNSQLIETLGFKKWEQFDATRKKAIDAGWLQYEGCGKRSAGRYFVTIPDGYGQVDDNLMEECISPEKGYKQGYDDGYKAGYDQGIKRGTIQGQSGGQSGDKQGEPSTLDPPPNTKNTPPKPPNGQVSLDLSGVEFPKEIDTPWMREAVREWVAFRKERTPAVKMIELKQTLAMLARLPADVAIASIYRTIAKNWQGMQTCPPEELALFTPKEVAQAKHEAEERRKNDLLAQVRRQREIESRAMEAQNAPTTRT